MWTPKRIIMLISGFAIFFVGYMAYSATYVGRIDSLPPLPERCWPKPEGAESTRVIKPPDKTFIDIKLEKAFGPGCEEVRRAHKLDLNAKSMLLSAESINFDNGRLVLTPVSVAVFGKDRDGKGQEINTIKAKVAYLDFDRPVNSPSEINGRKIMKAELIDDIRVQNNRRTVARDDDLTVYINKGPLYYDDTKHLIWTHTEVKLRDEQSKPDPIEIWGKGMEMELVTETPQARPGMPPPKQKNDTITGVKRVILKSDVTMNLYAAGGSAGMGVGKKTEPPVKPAVAPKGPVVKSPPPLPKDKIVIRTPGRFDYEFLKDHDLARFDVPQNTLGSGAGPQDVTVTRLYGKEGQHDQLVCQHLVLRLKKRDSNSPPATPTAAKPPAESPDQSLEIETAHATSEGKEVVLTSDAEKLAAYGTDFFYDARRKLTILKGSPEMWADKDGSIIYAREMQIQEMRLPPRPGVPMETYQQVIALGPGKIHMASKSATPAAPAGRPVAAGTTAAEKKTLHAYWNDRLISSKDGPHDLLVLIGAARFSDDDHGQTLAAETLKVWLLAEEPGKKSSSPVPSTRPGDKGPGEGGRKPHHLEAIKNVIAKSKELNVHDTERLVVWFKDVAELPGSPPEQKPTTGPAQPNPYLSPRPGATGAPATAPGGRPTQPSVPLPAPALGGPQPQPLAIGAMPAPAQPQTKEPPPRPIDLSARSVEAWVLRCQDKNQLQELWTEGNIHVRQDPAKPDEKAVDIRGSVLHMHYHPEGNELAVSGEGAAEGSDKDLAQLQMDKIYIIGPTVNIDQRKNIAWVDGVGAMQMESATNFQGSKLERPVPLTVHWSQRMYFNGRFADFVGNIQAEQQNARLACQVLQVLFDRPVSLKEGNRGDQPAKVRQLSCDRSVLVEDRTIERGQLVKYQLIRGIALMMHALDPDETAPTPEARAKEGNTIQVSGPGDVRTLQRDNGDPLSGPGLRAAGARPGETGASPGTVVAMPVSVVKNAPGGRPAGPGPKDGEMKMTYVTFIQRMDANSRTSTANFWGTVRVLHFPSDSPGDEEIDMDAMLARGLAPGVMHLRCDHLKVLDRPQNGRPNHAMHAEKRVRAQGKEFLAECDELDYEELKDIIVFRGSDRVPATLTRYRPDGREDTVRGTKILYQRSTGRAEVVGGNSMEGR